MFEKPEKNEGIRGFERATVGKNKSQRQRPLHRYCVEFAGLRDGLYSVGPICGTVLQVVLARADIHVGNNRVVVFRILRLVTFSCCHGAAYRKVPRTHFPLVVQGNPDLFIGGTNPFVDPIRDIGHLCAAWSERNTEPPNYIHRCFGYRNRSVFMGE